MVETNARLRGSVSVIENYSAVGTGIHVSGMTHSCLTCKVEEPFYFYFFSFICEMLFLGLEEVLRFFG